MHVFDVHAAGAHLPRLIERALAGEAIVIARGSTPVVRLVPVTPRRRPGTFKGEFEVGDAFFEPLPAEELEGWSPERTPEVER